MAATVASSRPNISTTGRTKPPFQLRAMRGAMGVLSRVSPEGAAAVAEQLFLTPRRRTRPKAEVDVLSLAQPRWLPTKHGTLAAWEWSPLSSHGADRRVLLVHGWEGRGAQLGPLVAALTALDFAVVTFDAPAHGDSPGSFSSLFHFAEAVTQAHERLGPFHAIISHSMGGPATLWASRNGALAGRTAMIAPPVDIRDFTRSFAGVLGLSEAVREHIHLRLGARFGIPIEEARAEKVAAALTGKLLVVHDEDDREVPIACGEAMARAWPQGVLLRTQGLGHQRILRDQGVQNAIVRFVAARDG